MDAWKSPDITTDAFSIPTGPPLKTPLSYPVFQAGSYIIPNLTYPRRDDGSFILQDEAEVEDVFVGKGALIHRIPKYEGQGVQAIGPYEISCFPHYLCDLKSPDKG